MLSGMSSRLVLVWRMAGCDSLASWYSDRPAEVRALRRVCLLVSCGVHRRHHCQWDIDPFRLVGVADTRRNMSERIQIAKDYFAKPMCCLRPGMAHDLRLRAGMCANALLSALWCNICFCFAVLVSMVVVDIEWRHGRNRGRSNKHGQTCLAQFTAKYVGGEATELHNAQVARNKITRSRQQALPSQDHHDLALTASLENLVRAPTAFWLWRRHAIRRDKEPR